MSTKKWLWVRVCLVACGGLSGISMTSPNTVVKSNIDWLACVVLLVACPFMLLVLIGIQAFNPMSAPIWRCPSWRINPFLLTEPLQFSHLVSFCFMADGVAGIATLPFRDISAAPLAVSLLCIGVGTWLGVQLCMKVFRKKMGAG